MTLESLRLWAHERTPGIPRNVDDLETVEFADVLGAIAEDPKSWEIKTWNEEEMSSKKLTEKMIYSNKCLFPVTQSPRKNVYPSSRCNQTVTSKLATSTERSTYTDVTYYPNCTKLHQHHKNFSMQKNATTQSRDLRHTLCHHLDPIRSITKWESMCSRSSTHSALASQS